MAADTSESSPTEWNEPILPIEPVPNLDQRKVELGRQLFADVRLSHSGRLSCASCHNLQKGGADRHARSVGDNGVLGAMNAPTVLNSGFNFSQFWDGRAETLEKQVHEPINSPGEMGSSWAEVVARLEDSEEYVEAFRDIYGDRIRSGHVSNAIAEFERSLSTPNSRFDRYLRHQPGALTAREEQGYGRFKSLGCARCHQGVNIGGNMYQKVGVMTPFFREKTLNKADLGRFNVTGDPRDLYAFKVPGLRNVALTAPYFHDGSASTLTEAVEMMGKYQLGRPLAAADVELVVEFLKTLTGELDGKSL